MDSATSVGSLASYDPRIGHLLAPLTTEPPDCSSVYSKLPGTYAELIAFDGKVKGTTYTSVPGDLTEWLLAKYVKATPAPTPTPGTTPTPKVTPTPIVTAPPGQPLYLYLGSYALKKYGQGCAVLITSVNGKTIKGDAGNALAIAFPNFKGDSRAVAPKSGPLQMTVKNLGPKGGAGSVVLMNAKGGGNLDTGTVTLTSRTEVKI